MFYLNYLNGQVKSDFWTLSIFINVECVSEEKENSDSGNDTATVNHTKERSFEPIRVSLALCDMEDKLKFS